MLKKHVRNMLVYMSETCKKMSETFSLHVRKHVRNMLEETDKVWLVAGGGLTTITWGPT